MIKLTMMKMLILNLLVFMSFAVTTVNAQMGMDPVRWHFSSKKIADKTYELHFTATIDHPWHIYSHDTPEDLGLPTAFTFNKNPLVEVTGTPKEVGKLIEEKVSDVKMKFYEDEVDFVQVVKLKSNVKTNISGKIDYMACTMERCLPPANRRFSISLN